MSAESADPVVGTLLAQYRIVAKLGEGGMGVVYRAHDTRLRRDVALKVLPVHAADDARARERLVREARIASCLNHPHICTIHEVGEAEGRVYVAMELVEGRSLRTLIPSRGMAAETVVRYGAQIARALDYAHGQGVVHRDLKSANVVIAAGGQAKLLDFGLSRRSLEGAPADASAESGTPAGVAGTPQYLAPEVLLGSAADARSDVWALGIVLYEMCAGRVPFGGPAVAGMVAAILHSAPDPLPAHIPAGLRSVITRCLAKDPEQRYQHALEAAAALETLLLEPAPGATPPAGPRRHRLAVSLGIAALAAVATLAWWLFRGGAPASPAETVLILPMEVRGQVGGAEFAGRAFSEALAVDLAQMKRVRVMPVPASADLPAASTLGLARAAFLSGAGRLVTGALTRDGDSLRASVSLIDAQANEVLWGEQRAVSGGDLAPLASSLALGLAERLGTPPQRRYDYFMYVTGPPEMATSPELAEALGAVRRYELPQSGVATQRLVERFPGEPDAHVLRLVALWIQAMTPGAQAPAPVAIASELEMLHRLDPRSPWVDLGRALMLPHGPRKVRLLGQVARRNDLTPAARGAVLVLRSDVLAALGDTASALADAERAIRLDPASDLSLATLARRLSETGRYRQAAERVRQAVALNPTVVNYWLQLGNCMLKQGQWEDYVADLEQAAARSPNADVILSAQSDGLSCVGRYREAAACARRALELKPANWYYGLQLALASMRLGAWREAAPLLDRACRDGFPINCPIRAAARAALLQRAGDAAGAAGEAREAARLAAARSRVATPETKSSAYALACYHVFRGERDEALQLLERFPGKGWIEPGLGADPNLAALRGEPRFRRVASWMRAQPIDHVFATWGRSP